MADPRPLPATDVVALHRLVALYGHVLDERAWDDLHLVFAEDAVFDLRESGWGLYAGRAEITRFLRDEALHPLGHHGTDIVVEGATGAEAVVRSKGIRVGRDRTDSFAYRDEVRQTAEGWRIVRRRARRIS